MNKIYPSVSNLHIIPDYFSYDYLKIYIKDSLKNSDNDNFSSEKVSVFILDKELWKDKLKDLELVSDENSANIILDLDSELKEEEYKININNNLINICSNSNSGFYYSFKTLEQILNNSKINNLELFDSPKLKVRGFMLDISRDKVATVESIKKLLDLCSDLKMNHFELYVEGFSFEFKEFKKYLLEDGYITQDEFKELQEYANNRYIDLVPNCNGFGHMAKWLEQEELKDLAVCPGGMEMWGRHRDPNTLDPLNPGSIELVKKLYGEMIPLATSKYFNMNFDEPFELGHGKSEGMDVGEIYIDFLNKAVDVIKGYGKIPLMWGDVLLKHSDKLDSLPKDLIFIDWGYDGPYQFDKHIKALKEKGISFMAAPGTTTWCSFLGRYKDWYENITNAIDAIYKYDGLGVLLTDWGDFGHLQFINSTYAPLIYCALYSWSHKEGTILDVRDYLNNYYQDKNNIIGDLLLDISDYYRYDMCYVGNATRTFHYFMWSVAGIDEYNKNGNNPIEYYKSKIGNGNMSYPKFSCLRKFLESKKEELLLVNSNSLEFMQTKEELLQSIDLVLMIQKLSLAYNESVDIKIRIKYLQEILGKKNEFILKQKKLWLARNKSGGLESSLSYIERFMEFVTQTLNYQLKIGEQ